MVSLLMGLPSLSRSTRFSKHAKSSLDRTQVLRYCSLTGDCQLGTIVKQKVVYIYWLTQLYGTNKTLERLNMSSVKECCIFALVG